MPMRRRLRLHAAVMSAMPALCGYTLDTTNTDERRPAIARATISSAPPSPYISAVSISVMPMSSPRCSAVTSRAARAVRSPIVHVPRPSAGTGVPSASVMQGMLAVVNGYPEGIVGKVPAEIVQ